MWFEPVTSQYRCNALTTFKLLYKTCSNIPMLSSVESVCCNLNFLIMMVGQYSSSYSILVLPAYEKLEIVTNIFN